MPTPLNHCCGFGCRPFPATVQATSREQALAMMEQARTVFVCAWVPAFRVFKVDKDQALDEIRRPMKHGIPNVVLHLPDAVFIEGVH